MKVYAITNQKGGTGKTTTATAIFNGARLKGKKALAIDLDPQGNLSYISGADHKKAGAYEVLTGKQSITDVIQHTPQGDVITANMGLATADTVITGENRTTALKWAILELKQYDIVVIDTPPTLNTLLLNALATATDVIIPIQADIFSLAGMYQLKKTITDVQKAYNPNLKRVSLLFTQYNPRTVLSKDVTAITEKRAKELDFKLLKTHIRDGVAIKEAHIMRKSMYEYAPKSKPVIDYMQLLDELKI